MSKPRRIGYVYVDAELMLSDPLFRPKLLHNATKWEMEYFADCDAYRVRMERPEFRPVQTGAEAPQYTWTITTDGTFEFREFGTS